MDLVSLSEIESQAVPSPHEVELKELGKRWIGQYKNFEEKELEKVSRLIGGERDNLGIDEEWALTKKFFPKVKAHLSYHHYGEEFSSFGEEDRLRFLFSGERVRDVAGDDLASMVRTMLNFIGRSLSLMEEARLDHGRRRVELRKKYYSPRNEAMKYLEKTEKELEESASFLGGQHKLSGSKHFLEKEYFPKLRIKVELGEDLRAICDGKMTKRMNNHELDLLIVYTLNHLIRFIAQKHSDKELPDICRQVFPV